jgi:hypothetical protein
VPRGVGLIDVATHRGFAGLEDAQRVGAHARLSTRGPARLALRRVAAQLAPVST